MDVRIRFGRKVSASLVVVMAVLLAFGAVASVSGQEARGVATVSPEQAKVQQYGLIAAAVAFGLGAIGAGIAIANVGAAAMGAAGHPSPVPCARRRSCREVCLVYWLGLRGCAASVSRSAAVRL